MRKSNYLLTALFLTGAVMAAGCGKGGKEDNSLTSTEAALNYEVGDYVKLGNYKNLEIQRPTASVSDEDMEMYIEEMLDENAEYREITDRAAKEGDSVNIDFTGTIGGEEFEGGSDTDYDLILGEGEFFEEFENNLIGKNVGETVTFSLTFPEDYDEELGGKEAEFEVKVNAISEVTVPEYNDAFVAGISEYSTIDEYEKAIREELLKSSQEEAVMAAGEDALAQAVENATVSGYPQAVYDFCYNETIESYQFYAELMGMDFDEFLAENMSEEDLESITISSVNEVLVVQAIAEEEGLQITDKNYKEEVGAMAEEYGYDSLEEFEADYGMASIVNMLTREKVVDFLYNSAKVEEVSQEEYYGEDATE